MPGNAEGKNGAARRIERAVAGARSGLAGGLANGRAPYPAYA